jgi:hypothetical protein
MRIIFVIHLTILSNILEHTNTISINKDWNNPKVVAQSYNPSTQEAKAGGF